MRQVRRPKQRLDDLAPAESLEEVLINLRARVIWFAAKARFIRGNKNVNFPKKRLEKMLDMTIDVDGHNIRQILERMPIKEQSCFLWRDTGLTITDPIVGSSALDMETINELLAYWRDKTGRGKGTVLTQARINMAHWRLSDGYTPEQLKVAVDQMMESDFHTSNNYTDVRYCWDVVRLERWLAEAGEAQQKIEEVVDQTIQRRRLRTPKGG